MSRGSKNINKDKKVAKDKSNDTAHETLSGKSSDRYLFQMSMAPKLNETTHWVQMLPALLFTAAIILITRMTVYERPMAQFFWSADKSQLTDFFSYYKMMAILICTALAVVLLLYRVFTQTLYIKRSFAYIPMIFYSLFVLLSYLLSDYKEFALWGWLDRFEGTLVLLSYMIMLFYLINSVNSEKNVKFLVNTLAIVSAILGLLGITQALGYDFFRTTLGKKLITPSWFWDQVDSLNFTFLNNEIYQTVYNINYVSFYLTLLIPIIGLLFIYSVMRRKEEPVYKTVLWGALFGLMIFNLIGSASSGGLMGMAFVVLIAIIVLNRRLITWWKPIVILVVITLVIGGLSLQRWLPELQYAVNSVTGKESMQSQENNPSKHKLDYIETDGNAVILGYEGEKLIFNTYPDDPASLMVTDTEGKGVTLVPTENGSSIFKVEDERYNWISVGPGKDDQGKHYIVISTDGFEWPFQLTEDGPKYRNGLNKLVDLREIPAAGWEDNQSFGSGRGYIWSRTIPMLKDTLLLGHGADTYCIYFPHDDYVGKYNAKSFSSNINIIVDKPHNLYMGYIIGTGAISMIALLVLWFCYIIQSFMLYRRKINEDFIYFVGVGIFLGICGFLAAALVNDSNVSVTPMFYGLLGTGIATNMMIKNKHE